MARFRQPTKDEIRERRSALAEKARSGKLQLPHAVVEMRMALGLSQERFAGILKLTKRQISEIERGKANPTAATLGRIGRLFGFELGFVTRQAAEPVPLQSAEPSRAASAADAIDRKRMDALPGPAIRY